MSSHPYARQFQWEEKRLPEEKIPNDEQKGEIC